MLRYFRINDPYRLVAVLILMILVYLPFFVDPAPVTTPEFKSILVGEKLDDGSELYIDVYSSIAPLTGAVQEFIDMIFGRSLLARHIIAFIILFLQSVYLGIIFITKKVFTENTFIPSLIFTVLCFFSFDTLALSGELLGSIFLLFALSSLFEELEFRNQRDETNFNIGIFLSFASLFHFAYSVFLFGVLIILFLFARTNLRKILLLIFGFLLPHLFTITIYYLRDGASEFWSQFYLAGISFKSPFLMSTKSLLVLTMVPVFYFVISLVMLNRLARFTKYQSQLLQSMFLWVGFCFIYFLFCRELRPQTLIVLIPPFTFLLTHFLLLIRRKKFAEMNTWLLLIGIITTSYLARYDRLRNVTYETLLMQAEAPATPRNSKILVLGNEIEYYRNNKVGSGFLDWNLSKPVFETPQFYESVVEINSAFKKDKPDVVIDENDLLKPFLEKIPELKSSYRRVQNRYELISR